MSMPAEHNPETTSEPVAPPAVAPPTQFWSSIYGLFLLAIIVAYFALMVYFAGELLQWAIHFIRETPSAGGWTVWVGYIALAAVLAFLLIRTVRHLIYASMGLVTPLHDFVPEASEGIEIKRDDHPELFALLDRVGQAVGAPTPDEVRVHHAPEPGAFELRQFGISTQRRLVLVLSLPQLGVLTADELGVIVAHELSHFGCGYTRLIVFLDRFLSSLRRSIDSIASHWWRWVDPIYWFQLAYWNTLVLLSAPMQRHQELRADSVSASLYGGELASRTLLKNWLLANQFLTAIGSYEPSDNDDEANNIFAWFRRRWRDFSPDGEDYLLRRLESMQQSSFWNDDPTIAQRVELMRTFPARDEDTSPPVFQLVGNLEHLEHTLHQMLLADE